LNFARVESPKNNPELQQKLDGLRHQIAKLKQKYPDTVVDRVGQTPLIALPEEFPGVNLWGKHEGYNPSNSIKDRTVLYLVADAMARGEVNETTTLVEASSGNTGIALAMLSSVMRQKVLIYMAEDASIERRQLIQAFGADIHLTPADQGTQGAIDAARAKHEDAGFYWIQQHENRANTLAHYDTTGAEVMQQCPNIDLFAATSGTTGTLVGVSMQMKEQNPNAKTLSIWPKDKIMGVRRPDGDCRPLIYDESWIDTIVEVTGEDAKAATRELALRTGLLVGPSAGAAWLGTRRWLKSLDQHQWPKNVVICFCDSGLRYLSTDTFDPNASANPMV
jgi:cysteine synthase B